ncbi:MAG: hypothetical protein AAF658_01265 [Myxococcota bacterium]
MHGNRVLVYPGQFDPFHRDHLAEIRGAMRPGDEAVVVPLASPKGSAAKQLAPHGLRREIIDAVVRNDSAVEVSSAAERKRLLTAPEIMDAIRGEQRGGKRLALLLGSDNFGNIATWRNAVSLLDTTDLVVNARPGFELDDPLAALPSERQNDYIAINPRLFLNPTTGRTIELKSIPSQDTSSWDVVQAIHGADASLEALVPSRRARRLMTQGYYAQLDLDHKSEVHAFTRAVRPALTRVLGDVTGGEFALDRQYLETLRTIPSNAPNLSARVATATVEAAKRSSAGLRAHPFAYSAGVALALDTEFSSALTPASNAADAPAPQEWSDASRSNAVSFIRERFGPLINAIESRLLRVAVGESTPTPERSQSPLPGDALVDLYIGLAPHVDIDALRTHGVLSPLERSKGSAEHRAHLVEAGTERAAMDHVLGHAKQGAFVSATLDPEVAKSYADAGGHLLTAKVPASQVVVTNDPTLWRNTAFAEEGNPEHFLHEVVATRITPEQIQSIQAVTHRDNSAVRLSDYVRSRVRLLRGALRKLS